MDFEKYMHLDKFGYDSVQGVEAGECYIFPKLDGTNASVWFDGESLQAGSRRRLLSLENDNAGFKAFVVNNPQMHSLMRDYPHLRLFGEWLVPHTLKTYRDDAWRKFYVFDVYDHNRGEFLSYVEYMPLVNAYGLDFIPPICVLHNPTYEDLIRELGNNTFLIQDGQGTGEGIVVKSYGFKNKYGKTVWAKLVSNDFKAKHVKEMGPVVKESKTLVEQKIVADCVDSHLVEKTHAKIINDEGGWSSKLIPRLLHTVYHDLISEELWDVVKKHKNPTVNFRTLNTLTTMKIKELKPELFA
jgi:hypothetical protein